MNNSSKGSVHVLITGGTGYIGSRLASKLAESNCKVCILTRDTNNKRYFKEPNDNILFYEYDETIESIETVLSKNNIEIVFHLASLVVGSHKFGQQDEIIDANIKFGTQLLEAMSKYQVSKIINVGSYWQNAQGDKKYYPVNLYAASKEAFEAIIKYYTIAKKLKAITLKLYDIYGPNDLRPKIFNLALINPGLEVSKGEQLISFVYIDDAVAGLIQATELLTENYQVYALANENLIELKAALNLLDQYSGNNLNLKFGRRPYHPREIMKPFIGPILHNWAPRVTLEEGLRKRVQAFVENKNG